MNKNLFLKTAPVHSTLLFSKINLRIIASAILFLGIFNVNGQNTSTVNLLKGFDEATVLKEFRQKEGSEIKYPTAYAGFLYFKKQEFIGKNRYFVVQNITFFA